MLTVNCWFEEVKPKSDDSVASLVMSVPFILTL